MVRSYLLFAEGSWLSLFGLRETTYSGNSTWIQIFTYLQEQTCWRKQRVSIFYYSIGIGEQFFIMYQNISYFLLFFSRARNFFENIFVGKFGAVIKFAYYYTLFTAANFRQAWLVYNLERSCCPRREFFLRTRVNFLSCPLLIIVEHCLLLNSLYYFMLSIPVPGWWHQLDWVPTVLVFSCTTKYLAICDDFIWTSREQRNIS